MVPREMKECDLVLKHIMEPTMVRKLFSNWEGPYEAREKLLHNAYKLEELNSDAINRS